MTTTAFVFPGQGSQQPGMGEPFFDAWPATRDRLADLSAALDDDLATLCFDGDADTLRATRNTQPALFAVGLATLAGLRARTDLRPDYVAGHSLGHFTALAAAGALEPAAGVSLVRKRGELLAEAGREAGPGTMCAVLLADPVDVAAACADRDDVGVGLYNGPRQTVVSGTREGVEHVRAILEATTRARFRDLEVAAAFHSPVMEPAREAVDEVMAAVDLAPADVPVVSDVSGRVYTDPAVARRDLAEQVTAPVDWHGVVATLRERGVDRYVSFPPAETLASLIGRIDPDAEVIALAEPADLERLESGAVPNADRQPATPAVSHDE